MIPVVDAADNLLGVVRFRDVMRDPAAKSRD